jgi:hydrogenase nickel incorporation protein HypB
MCTTCGCDHDANVTITKVGEEQFRPVGKESLLQLGDHRHSREIELERNILDKNDSLASHNRKHFSERHIFALNLVSSPGSGKTSLLERTLRDLKDETHFFVIEGDQQTTNDADRIAATGVPAVQINTGKGCHLDADMVHRALHKLDPVANSILFIENVGNLVCPAMFDLGENVRITVISVTEGDDKPLKYPDMFESSDLCIVNKIDLLPYVNFRMTHFQECARRVNPDLKFLLLSATTGEGMQLWYRWLKENAPFCFSNSELEVCS